MSCPVREIFWLTTAGLIREAVSKVRSVLPGAREDSLECEPPPCLPPGSTADTTSQAQRFIEAVREAAAAAASEVGLDVNLEAAAEGSRRYIFLFFFPHFFRPSRASSVRTRCLHQLMGTIIEPLFFYP